MRGGNPERARKGALGKGSTLESREEASGLSATASEGPLRHQGHGPQGQLRLLNQNGNLTGAGP